MLNNNDNINLNLHRTIYITLFTNDSNEITKKKTNENDKHLDYV